MSGVNPNELPNGGKVPDGATMIGNRAQQDIAGPLDLDPTVQWPEGLGDEGIVESFLWVAARVLNGRRVGGELRPDFDRTLVSRVLGLALGRALRADEWQDFMAWADEALVHGAITIGELDARLRRLPQPTRS